jgi:hypothetical protein
MFRLPDQPSSVGRILDVGFQLFAHSFSKNLPLILGMGVLYVLWGIYVLGVATSPSDVWVEATIGYLLITLVSTIPAIAMIYRTGNRAHNREDSLKESLGVGLRKFFPFLLTSIFYALAFIGGTILLILPGIYLWLALSFYIYLLVFEDSGMSESLQRSYHLVTGNWWHSAFVFFVPVILMIEMYLAIGFALTSFGFWEERTGDFLSNIIEGVLDAFIYPFYYAIGFVLLNDLKLRRSGSDLAAKIEA